MWNLDDWNKYTTHKNDDYDDDDDEEEYDGTIHFYTFIRKSSKVATFPEDSLLKEVQLYPTFKSKTHYDALTLVISKSDKTLLEKLPPKGILKREVSVITFVKGVIGSTKV